VLGSLLLTLGVLAVTAWALQRSGLAGERLWDLLAEGSTAGMVAAIGLMTCGTVFQALRWRSLMPEGERLPLLGLSGLIVSGLLLNFALPGPVGELAVAVLVERRWGYAAPKALAASLLGRFVGLGTAGALAGVVWATGTMPVPDSYSGLIGASAVAIAVGAACLGLVSLRPQLLARASAATFGRPRAGRLGRWTQRIHVEVERLTDALVGLGRLGWGAYGRAVLWAMCGHAMVISGIFVAALSLGLKPDLAGTVFTYAAATAGVVAMFALPGGQIGWDAMFCAFFRVTAGVSLIGALGVTVLVRLQQVVLLLLGGASLAAGSWKSRTDTPQRRQPLP
jgi:hypothetical protein